MGWILNPFTGTFDFKGGGSSGSGVESVVAGDNVQVDATDPQNPIVSATDIHVPALIVAASDAPTRAKEGADYLCDGTDDQVQINAAIAALGDGGKVILSQGTFSINSNTVFADNILLEGQGQATILRIANGSQANGILVDSVSDVLIRDLLVNGNKNNVDTGGTLYTTINGIRINGATNVVVQSCTCISAYYGGINVEASSDIQLLGNLCYSNRDNQIFLRPANNRVLIEGNIAHSSDFSGIQSLHSDYVDVVGNVAYSNGPTLAEGDGIGFEGCRYSRISNNIIHSNGIQGVKVDYTVEGGEQRSLSCVVENNTIYDHTDSGNGCGIEVLRSDDTTIQGNRIKEAKYGINVGEVGGIKILDNIVTDTDSQGIRIHDTGATGVVIDGNTVTTTGSHGIEVFQDRVRITNNIVSASADQGIRISNGDNDYIARNTIFDNVNNGVLISSDAGPTEIRDNHFYNTGSAQDRAVYEEAGTGATRMVNNRIVSMATAEFEFNRATSIFISETVFNENGADVDYRAEGDTATSLFVLDAGLDAVQIGTTTAGAIADFRPATIVFNEASADIDFRVESNGDANAFFVDGGADRIGMGNNAPISRLNLGNAGSSSLSSALTGTLLTLAAATTPSISISAESTGSSGSGGGSGFAFYSNDGAAMASGDRLGFAFFGGSSSASALRNAVGLFAFTTQAWVDGSAYGAELRVETTPNTTTSRSAGVIFTSEGGMTINEQGRNADTRVEGDADANLIFVDASADFVGIGNASPAVKLDVTGEIRASSAGTNSASVVTVGGTQTLTSKTLTAPTIGGHVVLNESAAILLDPALSADGTYNGIVRAGTAGATLAFGDLIYLDPTDSRWELADANAASGADGDSRGVLGICVLAAAGDGSATTVLLQGIVRADTAFPSMTINNPQYVSETAGDITGTQPTTADVVIRVVGVALTADELYFNPSCDYITHT